MYRHIRRSCKIAPNERNGLTGMSRLYDLVDEKQHEDRRRIHVLEEQNAEMRAKLAKMEAMVQQVVLQEQDASGQCSCPENAHTVGKVAIIAPGDQSEIKIDNRRIHTHYHQNQNNIAIINVFGQERLDHITQSQIHQILTGVRAYSLFDAAIQAVLQAAMLAYSDPEHPENLTCYLPNKKTKDALVHGGTGWEIQPVQLVLPPMMQKSIDLLFHRQPLEGLERDELEACGKTLKELETCEQDPLKARQLAGPDGALRAVLIRNKDQLARILAKLPVAGQS